MNGLQISGQATAAQRPSSAKKSYRPPSSSRARKSTDKSTPTKEKSSSRASVDPPTSLRSSTLSTTPPPLNLSNLSSTRSNGGGVDHLLEASKPWQISALESSEKRISTPNLPPDYGLPDDFLSIVHRAACTIQIWYRYKVWRRNRYKERRLKTLLEAKRKEMDDDLKQEQELLSVEKSANKRKLEEEKKREERRRAIEDLQKKREERARIAFEKAEEEMKMVKEKKKSESGNLRKSVKSMKPVEKLSADIPEKDIDIHRKHPNAVPVLPQSPEQPNAPVPSPSNAMDSSRTATIDDLFDTLKQLEEPEDFPESLKTEKFLVENTNFPMSGHQSDSSRTCNDQPNVHNSPSRSAKLNEILQFLEKADQEEEEIISGRRSAQSSAGPSQDPDGAQREEEAPELPPPVLVPSAEELLKLEEASRAAAEVNDSLLQSKMQLAEKTRTVEMLTKALNQQRELTVRHAKEQDRETKRRLNEMKTTLEQKIQRQTGFIDQLIESNTKLSEKCQSLTVEVKDITTKYERKIKQVTDTADTEKKKLKDTLMTAEKMRREKWMEEQTRNLKDITVKGLEPEIQKLIANHKAEMRKLKALHEAEVAAADERAAQRYTAEKDIMRANLQQELEAACEKERELAKQRYEKQLEQEEVSFQQQRRRLHAEVQEEKSRVNELAQRQRHEVDLRQKQLEESSRRMMEDMRKEYEKARLEQEARHAELIQEIKQKAEAEKAAWEETYMKKQEAALMAKERELTEKVRSTRDKEIELVITRLETDMEKSRVETEKAAENRVRRVREKYEGELRELEAVERNTTERLNNLKAQYAELEGENARMKTLLKEKDHDLDQITKIKEKLTRERDSMSDVIRQEFADRLVSTEDENRRLKNEMSELKAKNKLEIDRINRDKQDELDEVHKRIKQALVKKEEIVSELRGKYEAAEKRADHLESLLASLRKQNVNVKNK